MFAFRKNAWALNTVANHSFQDRPSLTDLTSGLIAGTRVATPSGWRDVAAIAVGDQVLTFDGGLQKVTSVRHTHCDSSHDLGDSTKWPVLIPAGTFGDHEEMTVLPGQPVMIEADLAEDLFGDPFAIVPAHTLVGYAGIDRVLPASLTHIVSLAFDGDEVVFANRGGLLVCPTSTDLLDAELPAYPTLTDNISALLVNAMKVAPAAQGGYRAAA